MSRERFVTSNSPQIPASQVLSKQETASSNPSKLTWDITIKASLRIIVRKESNILELPPEN